jgi:hypothetical protein
MRKRQWSLHARRQSRSWSRFLVNLSRSISDLIVQASGIFILLNNWKL